MMLSYLVWELGDCQYWCSSLSTKQLILISISHLLINQEKEIKSRAVVHKNGNIQLCKK